jgi:hypothetical protein
MSGSGRYDLSEVGPYDHYDGSRFYRKADFVVVRRLGATKSYEVTTKFSVRSAYNSTRLFAGAFQIYRPSYGKATK